MKKLLFVFTLLFCCWGCEEDENLTNSPVSIIGTWKVDVHTSFSSEGFIDPVSDSLVTTETFSLIGLPEGGDGYFSFLNDSVVLFQNYTNGSFWVDTSIYTQSGNVFYLDNDNVFTVTELTSTNMSYHLVYTEYENLQGNDTTFVWWEGGFGDCTKSDFPY